MVRRFLFYVVLVLLSILVLVPFAYLICSSLKGGDDFFSSLFLPAGDGFLGVAWNHLTLNNFMRVLNQPNFARSIVNSFFFSSVTGVLATLASAMGGYALACFRFPGRRLIKNIVMASLVFPTVMLPGAGLSDVVSAGDAGYGAGVHSSGGGAGVRRLSFSAGDVERGADGID